MLDTRQNLALRDLARSAAKCVETLGVECTARLLAVVALGLVDDRKQVTDPDSTPASGSER